MLSLQTLSNLLQTYNLYEVDEQDIDRIVMRHTINNSKILILERVEYSEKLLVNDLSVLRTKLDSDTYKYIYVICSNALNKRSLYNISTVHKDILIIRDINLQLDISKTYYKLEEVKLYKYRSNGYNRLEKLLYDEGSSITSIPKISNDDLICKIVQAKIGDVLETRSLQSTYRTPTEFDKDYRRVI